MSRTTSNGVEAFASYDSRAQPLTDPKTDTTNGQDRNPARTLSTSAGPPRTLQATRPHDRGEATPAAARRPALLAEEEAPAAARRPAPPEEALAAAQRPAPPTTSTNPARGSRIQRRPELHQVVGEASNEGAQACTHRRPKRPAETLPRQRAGDGGGPAGGDAVEAARAGDRGGPGSGGAVPAARADDRGGPTGGGAVEPAERPSGPPRHEDRRREPDPDRPAAVRRRPGRWPTTGPNADQPGQSQGERVDPVGGTPDLAQDMHRRPTTTGGDNDGNLGFERGRRRGGAPPRASEACRRRQQEVEEGKAVAAAADGGLGGEGGGGRAGRPPSRPRESDARVRFHSYAVLHGHCQGITP